MSRAVIEYHDDVEQGSQEWLDVREGKYTGSNAHKLLGGIGVLEYAKSKQSGFGGNFWTKRGHLLEDEAIELYSLIHDTKVLTTGYVTNSLFPGCLYSPDGLADEILLEVKCFSLENHMQLVRAKSALDLPVKITAQIHYGMVITGRRKAILIAYNPKAPDVKDKYKEIVVRYDPDIAENFKRILSGALV